MPPSESDGISATKPVPAGSYDLSKPARQWTLGKELKEISGLAWIDNEHLLAIEDLHPILYFLKLGPNAIIEKKVAFGPVSDKKFDVEDVAIANQTVYALWSHGAIYKIENWKGNPVVKKIQTFLSKENNTEGLAYDPVSGNLLVACKNDAAVEDEKKSTRSVFAFNLKSETLQTTPYFLIHKKDFKKLGDKPDLNPSAIAVHPITHDIYILSTRGTKCLAQYSHEGVLKNVQLIDKTEMVQPEGMCFAPDGTLFISTEGKHGTPAAIFQFAYKKE